MKNSVCLTNQEVMKACESSIQQGRRCQLKLTRSVVQSDAFKSWILELYQQYPAAQLRQQLRFVDQGDSLIRQPLDSLLQMAALMQLMKAKQDYKG